MRMSHQRQMTEKLAGAKHGLDADPQSSQDKKTKTGRPSDPEVPGEKMGPWQADSNQVVQFGFVQAEQELTAPAQERLFNAVYTHQIFEDEVIHGYAAPKALVLYSAATAHCCVRFAFEKQASREELRELGVKRATPVAEKLKEVVEPLESDDALKPFLKEWKPPGEIVHNYSVNGAAFAVFKLDMTQQEARALLDRLEALVLFFIDGGSTVDSSDPDWEPYVLYEMKHERPMQIIGFATAYRFYAYPEHERLRLSQFLILPPFQKAGHGSRLLRALHEEAAKRPKCISLTVEDPSPDLQHLRNKMYLEQLQKLRLDRGASIDLAQLQKELRIPKIQARRLLEILEFERLDTSDEKRYTQYRLGVKRRLDKLHKEDISYNEDGNELTIDEKKERLHELYLKCEEAYRKLLQAPKLHSSS